MLEIDPQEEKKVKIEIEKEDDPSFEIPQSVVINGGLEVKEFEEGDEYLYWRVKGGERQEIVSVEEIRGYKGLDGIDGIDGIDGYTPMKGVDYFDGVDGKDGRDGKDGKDGKNGVNGIDAYDMFLKQGGQNIGRQQFSEILKRNIEANWTIIGGNNGIQSITAGSNITIDDTDPRNPVISATGGGGGGSVTSVNGQTGDVVLQLGDRYKTTSTTSQTIVSTGTLTFTVGSDLAYTALQDVIIAYDTSNHMHGTVVSYSGTTLVVDIQHKAGSGTYASWTINLDAIEATPVTVTDSTTIDLTITSQDITASVKDGSIDSTKLSTAVNNTIAGKLDANTPITGATKTKITYDADGLVTAGADATTDDIADSTDKRYVTDAQLTVIGNTSGTNSGNETATTIGSLINGSTEDTTLIDADMFAIRNSVGGLLEKFSWLNMKSNLKTYFDTLYAKIGATTSSGLTMSTARILGRSTAGTGAIEEITIGSGLSMTGGTLSATGGSGASIETSVAQVRSFI